jgi:hypothetical protein
MSMNQYLPKKVDLTPKRHHGFNVLLFILGMLLPPLGELHPLFQLHPHGDIKRRLQVPVARCAAGLGPKRLNHDM